MERTLKEAKEEWKGSTKELQWSVQTSGIRSSKAHCTQTKSKSTQHGDKTSENNCNWLTLTTSNFEDEFEYHKS